ncbi:uncharacterized protein METZ01_LOCUS34161, partial [marine metagenome]
VDVPLLKVLVKTSMMVLLRRFSIFVCLAFPGYWYTKLLIRLIQWLDTGMNSIRILAGAVQNLMI